MSPSNHHSLVSQVINDEGCDSEGDPIWPQGAQDQHPLELIAGALPLTWRGEGLRSQRLTKHEDIHMIVTTGSNDAVAVNWDQQVTRYGGRGYDHNYAAPERPHRVI